MEYRYYIALEIGDKDIRNITVLSETSYGKIFLPLWSDEAICYSSIEAAKQELANFVKIDGIFILIV